jgi:ribosomal protein S18 acetylase RimI-like enzyme
MDTSGHDIAWAASAEERAAAARFFARVIPADPAYISHGEIQAGLSPDGKTWAPDLERRFLEEIGGADPARGIAIMRDAAGAVVAAASVTWSLDGTGARFATLQDLAVEPALRSAGLGAAMLAFVEDEARRRGAQWLFLESGRNNRRAHAFFERHGFGEVSHVFAKRYG